MADAGEFGNKLAMERAMLLVVLLLSKFTCRCSLFNLHVSLL